MIPDTAPEDTRTLILQTAEGLFMRHGYGAVSMNQIVSEISKVRRLTKPAIYYHFEDKERLFAAVMFNAMERHGRALMAAAQTEGNLQTRLVALAETVIRGRPRHFERAQADFRDHASEETLAVFRATLVRSLVAPLVAAFAQAGAQGELRAGVSPEIAAAGFFGIVTGLDFILPDSGTPEDLARRAVDIYLHGIAAP